ncbi:hypothetical protein VT98_12681, partial [Candidatus Electrothrix communis]
MPYNPIRLRNYDYARAWAYFVTICTQHRKCLFGEITNGVMRLNDAGNIDAREWMETARQLNWTNGQSYPIIFTALWSYSTASTRHLTVKARRAEGNRGRSTFYAQPVIRPHPGRFYLT